MPQKYLLLVFLCCLACKAKTKGSESLPSGFFENKSCGSLRFPEANFADSGVFHIINTGNERLIATVTYGPDKTEAVRGLINSSFVYACVKSDHWQTDAAEVRSTSLKDMAAVSDIHKN